MHNTETTALDVVTTLPSVPVEIASVGLAPFDWKLVPPHPARASVRMGAAAAGLTVLDGPFPD